MTPFQIVCFNVLMDHHRKGIELAHPDYIKEKLWMLESKNEADAFAALDIGNQVRVVIWCRKWGVEIPKVLENHEFPFEQEND